MAMMRFGTIEITRGCTGEMAKVFFLPITMKLASLVEIIILIIYHQGTEAKCVFCDPHVICM
jgi:hypothetical protein